jgi:hypothetical protein
MMRVVTAPPGFDESFIAWFRAKSERMWSSTAAPTFDELEAKGVSGLLWDRGTRWTNGLSDREIDLAEARWSLRFPPDFRLFLRLLHVPDRPMIGRGFVGSTAVPIRGPSFYDWREQSDAIRRALDWPADGLVHDVEHNDLWLREWGPRPSSAIARRARVREAVAAAPRLIPILGHRYLVAEPSRAGNPVLSVYQSDIIVYGNDLRDYLLRDVLARGVESDRTAVGEIPFWGQFLTGDAFDRGSSDS